MTDANWHYARGDERGGPVSAAEIERLIRDGELTATDVVWTRGMPDWQSVADSEDFGAVLDELPPPLPRERRRQEIEPDDTEDADEFVDIASIDVAPPAGPWTRYFARTIDLSVLSTVAAIIFGTVLAFNNPSAYIKFANTNYILQFVLMLPAAIVMNGLIVWLTGRSLGKWIFGIRAEYIEGGRLRFLDALAREVKVWFYALVFGIPIVSWFTVFSAMLRVNDRLPTTYDAGEYIVRAYSSSRIRRAFGISIAILLSLGIAIWNGCVAHQQNAQYISSTWTNPVTGLSTTLPVGWNYSTYKNTDGETVYTFANVETNLIAVLGGLSISLTSRSVNI